ncbi:MAG: hypothetical protein PVJ34_07235 [Anaerolineae bacterium]
MLEQPAGHPVGSPLLAAALAAALVEYRSRIAGASRRPASPGGKWQTVARWEQLVPPAHHRLQR